MPLFTKKDVVGAGRQALEFSGRFLLAKASQSDRITTLGKSQLLKRFAPPMEKRGAWNRTMFAEPSFETE